MSEYQNIPVETARDIADRFNKCQVVILCYDREHNLTHTTTYGKELEDKENAAATGEICAKAIGCDLGKSLIYEDFHANYEPAKLAKAKEILEWFANKTDPVYDTRIKPPVPGTPASLEYSSVKMCKLCGAHGGHNQENVRHNLKCPWMDARRFLHDEKPIGKVVCRVT